MVRNFLDWGDCYYVPERRSDHSQLWKARSVQTYKIPRFLSYLYGWLILLSVMLFISLSSNLIYVHSLSSCRLDVEPPQAHMEQKPDPPSLKRCVYGKAGWFGLVMLCMHFFWQHSLCKEPPRFVFQMFSVKIKPALHYAYNQYINP